MLGIFILLIIASIYCFLFIGSFGDCPNCGLGTLLHDKGRKGYKYCPICSEDFREEYLYCVNKTS